MKIHSLIPRYSFRYIIGSKLFRSLNGDYKINPFFHVRNFFDCENLKMFAKYTNINITCSVCGCKTKMLYDFPCIKQRRAHHIGVLRETLQCKKCGATMRDRSLAHALLLILSRNTTDHVGSIAEWTSTTPLSTRILDTDAFSPISKFFKDQANYLTSSFVPEMPFGTEIEDNRFNINLEKISFESSSFDIILTSDVAEHIRDIDEAHREIYRVLKPGGSYIFTVPFDNNCSTHHILVSTDTDEDVYLRPPHYHGDPLTGGILAYRIFGRKLFEDLKNIGFNVEFLELNNSKAGIFCGDVFIATK